MKRLAVLGSTGSIGTNTLRVVAHLSGQFKVTTLAANSNIDLLEKQAHEFHPELIAVFDKDKALELQKRLPNTKVVGGMDGLLEAATHENVDYVVSAIVGTTGILPTVAAIEAKKTIGLANKETLVSGGAYITDLAKKHGVQIIPIDSEHSALFQCLNGEDPKNIRRLILTASGGPFRSFTQQELDGVTPESALKHPNWDMGAKVTIDSSTLMNKGLETIEARWLFDIPPEKIDVVVHPQSIIHSMIEFVDGSIMAQMGVPDMITPIQYALTYPDRAPGLLKPFDFTQHSKLEFLQPDIEKFPCLDLAHQSMMQGGSLPGYMNAANEVLVQRFLNKDISWKGIGGKLETLMSKHKKIETQTLESILETDKVAREEAQHI